MKEKEPFVAKGRTNATAHHSVAASSWTCPSKSVVAQVYSSCCLVQLVCSGSSKRISINIVWATEIFCHCESFGGCEELETRKKTLSLRGTLKFLSLKWWLMITPLQPGSKRKKERKKEKRRKWTKRGRHYQLTPVGFSISRCRNSSSCVGVMVSSSSTQSHNYIDCLSSSLSLSLSWFQQKIKGKPPFKRPVPTGLFCV